MMRLALGAKLGNPGRPPAAVWGATESAAKVERGRRLASAIAPRPRAVLAKKWRRVRPSGPEVSYGFIIGSAFPDGGVKIKDGLGDFGGGSEIDGLERGVGFGVADGDEFGGVGGRLGVGIGLFAPEIGEDLGFSVVGFASGETAEGEGDFLRLGRA